MLNVKHNWLHPLAGFFSRAGNKAGPSSHSTLGKPKLSSQGCLSVRRKCVLFFSFVTSGILNYLEAISKQFIDTLHII